MNAASPVLVIVGASYAGAQLAASARDAGFDGRILLIGDETRAPYQRPPLSKGLLTGKTQVDALALKADDFYCESGIELLTGHRVTALDTAGRVVVLDDGRRLGYDWLALTTGARCRPLTLPGAHLAGVFELRSLGDALALDAAARNARRACVIGGGFIGLEVASALATRGLQVSVVEAAPRLLARAVTPELSDFVAALHRRHGVDIHCGQGVRTLIGQADRVTAVELQDGERIACDLVVAGIGVLPNTGLAERAGIACANGILTDALGRTSVPQVLAAGDCAAFPNPYAADPAAPIRLESIQAANDLARAAASLVAGRPQPYSAVPWFWSDQYDAKLQMAGLMAADDEVVVRGDIASGRFSLFCLRGGRIAAVHTISRPADHMLGRKLVAARCAATPARLADEGFDLKSLLAVQACSSCNAQ